MRHIKFRAWDKNTHSMLSWFYITNKLNEIEARDLFVGKGYYNRKDLILMQYTGLQDKNGKEVYEGDILDQGKHWWRTKSGKPYKGCKKIDDDFVEAHGKHCYTIVERTPPEMGFGFTGFGYAFVDSSKIIGNIYQNPELLK